MADKNAAEGIASLHQYKIQTRTDPTSRFATVEDPGRADVMCAYQGRGVYIEFKCGGKGFSFDDWRPNQRAWAEQWAIGTGTDYYLWLRLGIAPASYLKNDLRKRTWLVPFYPMLAVIALVSQVQNTLPLLCTSDHKIIMRENGYDAITQLSPYELSWAGGGKWAIPESHIFSRTYLQQAPLGVVTVGQPAWEQV